MVNQPKASAWHVAILVIAGLGAYANAIPNGFVHDDHKLLEEESRITGPIDIRRIFQTNYWGERLNAGLYRPLTVLSFAVDHAAFGLEPAAFHAVNVILHAGAGVALYFLLLSIFRSAPVAFGASILFALHPVHTEAVSGVVGRSEVLAALFGFLSLRLALPPFSLNRLGFSLASLLLALLSKESAIVFLGLYPLALVLAPGLEWRRREAAITFGCLAAVAGCWFLLRWSVIGSFLAPEGYVATFLVNPLAHLEPAPRWAAALAGLGKYLLLLLLPANLSADYSYDQIPFGDDLSWIRIALSAGVIAALVVMAVRWRQTRPTFTFGVGWFFIAILPTSNLIFPIGSIFAERFLYLPSVGYCLILGAALDRWRVRGGLQGKLAIGSLVSICLLYAAGTVERNRDWATDETLMVSVVKNAPNSAMGRYEMGRIRQEQRRENEAKQLYKEAIDIYPDFALAHYNRGQIYRLHGEYDAAILDYMEAIRVDPDFAEAYHNLAISRSRQGHQEEAIEDLQEAVSRNPRLELAWMDLFRLLEDLKRYEEAIQALEGLIEANPTSVAAHLRAFEIYYTELDDWGKARMYLQKAYQIDPEHPDIKALPPNLLDLLR